MVKVDAIRTASAKSHGMTAVEAIISIGVFAVIAVGIYSSTIGLIRLSKASRLKVAATTVANRYAEIVRNLPYASVGIQNGIPNGILPATQTVTSDNTDFRVTYTVRNTDDPFDGTIGGTPNDTAPADYKQVTVEVSCVSCGGLLQPIRLTTIAAPKNLESSSTNGALFIQVLDANGQAVAGASVHVENTILNPTISIDETTNLNGLLQLVDVPPAIESYHIVVTKNGYSTDQTYSPNDVVVVNPIKLDATVITQQVTQISFAIDRVSTLKVSSLSTTCSAVPNVDFSLTGSKLIGTNPDVLKYSQNLSTDGAGIKLVNNLEWDTYNSLLTDSTNELRGTIPLKPINLAPNSSQELKFIVQPKTPHSLLVSVRDDSTGLPLSGAAVRLTKPGFDQTILTSRGYIQQTNWQGGPGQEIWSDETMYSSDDGNVSVNQPVGELKLRKVSGDYVAAGLLTSSTFDTGADVTPPTISNVISSNIGTSSATIAWNTDEPADTQVEYGTTTAYELTSVLDSTLVIAHVVTLQGLTDAQVYHYRVVSRDAGGNVATSTDRTFTTGANPSAPESINEQFTGPPLDSAWTWTDPIGNSSYTLASVPDHLQIQVASGSSHDCWTGVTNCPRMLRNVDSNSVVYETKIDGTNLGSERHSYGIMLWQDSSNYIRFEYHYEYTASVAAYRVISGTGSTALAGAATSMGAANYLRVSQTGTSFTLQYSQNGSSWTTVGSFSQSGFVANEAGLFVINAGGSPLTTAKFDYFTSSPLPDTTPPSITGVTSSNLTATTASITWTTDELSDTQVEYGLSTSYGQTTSLNSTPATLHLGSISELTTNTTYHYRVKSRDANNNLATSGDYTFVTSATTFQGVVRDDFNGEPLDTAWTWTDSRANSSNSLTANPGHLQISLPAGTDHDCWNSSTSCARVMRSATNSDAIYETKIDGVNINSQYQTYGLMLWQNSQNFMRFEYYTSGGSVATAAFKIINGSGSQVINKTGVSLGITNYLRVTKTGDTFQLEYSQNGTAWTSAGSFTQAGFTVNQAGLYVDNATGGTSPATTANFDYFMVRPFANTAPAIIEWQPGDQSSQVGANAVRFQIATNNDNITWNFIGPDGTASSYYTVSGQTVNPIHYNDRYLRYRVYLSTANINYTPNISDVNITFASGCVPPGQAFFTKLSSATYTLTITLSGYETSTTSVNMSPNWNSQDINLTVE